MKDHGGTNGLQEILIDELRDMYSAENQLVKAHPKLAKGAINPKLKQLFATHLEETKGQVESLKQVFAESEEKPTGQHCNGMEGVIEEGKDALEKGEEEASFDSGLIGAALRTEHYEIAGYEACLTTATTLGMSKVVKLPASLRTLHYVEAHRLAFQKATESIALNGGVMDKNIFAVLTARKPNPFASLNHFTDPCSMNLFLIKLMYRERNVECLRVAASQNKQFNQIGFIDLFKSIVTICRC